MDSKNDDDDNNTCSGPRRHYHDNNCNDESSNNDAADSYNRFRKYFYLLGKNLEDENQSRKKSQQVEQSLLR